MNRKTRNTLPALLVISVMVFGADRPLAADEGSSPRDSPSGDTEGTTHAPQAEVYELVWADEFNENGPPDAEYWDFEHGFVRNHELQWYQSQNARCENGILTIEARREQVPNPRYDPASGRWQRQRQIAEYTSASLVTRRFRSWTFGRFEMRGRIDTRAGLWPAFWTLGSARGWPGCGEIDIMEYYEGKLLANACWLGDRRGRAAWDSSKWDSSERPLAEFRDPQWSNKFHTWRMDWREDRIDLYVDELLLNTIDVNKTINSDQARSNPFREPHYILLNLAVGGTRGGDPSATQFPARFEVDYVRVYQNVKAGGDRGDEAAAISARGAGP
jgi:beta-glucanase (GH16 family)